MLRAMSARACPVCETEAPEGSTQCSYCKRVFEPGDFDEKAEAVFEAPEDPLKPKPQSAFKRRLPYIFTAIGTFALAAAFILQEDLRWHTENAMQEAVHVPDAPKPGRDLPVSTTTLQAPTTVQVPTEPEAPKEIPADGHAIRKGKDRWQVTGKMFQIVDGKPAAGVRIVFIRREDRKEFYTMSDRRGRFKALLEADEAGYSVDMRRFGAELNFTEDWLPSILGYPDHKKKEIAVEISEQPPTIEHLFWLGSGKIPKVYGVVEREGTR